MSAIICCSATDRFCCYWASINRRNLLNIELGLQVCSFILYTTVLIFASSTTPSVMEMAYFVRYDISGFENWQRKYNANYSSSLSAMTWVVNSSEVDVITSFDNHPDRRYENLNFEFSSLDDGMTRVTATLAEFKEFQQADIDAQHSRPHQKLAYAVGVRLQDAPWAYDLAVDEYGNACDNDIYVYSYEWAYEGIGQGSQCNPVFDRDGTQGHIHSYGPYDGTSVSISVMLADQVFSKKARLCSPPTQELHSVVDMSCPGGGGTMCSSYSNETHLAVLNNTGRTSDYYPDAARNASAIALGHAFVPMGVDYMTCSEAQYYVDHYLEFRPVDPRTIDSCHTREVDARPTEQGGNGKRQECCVFEPRPAPSPPTPPLAPLAESSSGASDEWDWTWASPVANVTPGVCYRLTEIILTDPTGDMNMMNHCLPASNRVYHLIVSMLILSIARIGVGLVYLQRWSAKSDQGKKGINIWLCIIPAVASIVPIVDYQNSCVVVPDGWPVTVESGPGLSLLAIVPVIWMACLVIELIIPAGKYAIKEIAPPPGMTEVQVVPNMKASNTRSSNVDLASAPWMDVAATKVQSMFRGRNTRQVVVAHKSEENAATKVQAMFRGRSVRSASSKLALEGDASAGASTAGPSSDGVDAESGTLQIHLQRARGLMSADRNGLSDPYATLSLAGQSHKSKTIRNTLNPDWDEVIQFEGNLSAMVAEGLSLQVFDWDFGSRDDKLGEAKVDLSPLRTERQVACTTKLPEPGKGEVQLHLSWAPGGETHPPAPELVDDSAALSEQLKPGPVAAEEEEPPSADPLKEKGILRVTLNSARGLVAADENGKSDPYVKMHLAGQIFKSKVKKKTLTPHWDETYDFKIERGQMASQQLKLVVFDFDTGSLDDKIGTADVDITALTKESRKSMEVTLSTVKKRGVMEGVKGVAAKAAPHAARALSASDSSAGTVYLRLRWVGQETEAMKWLNTTMQSMGDVGGQVLTAAARFLVDPLGAEASNEGEGTDQPEWAKRQYYVIIWDGPRAGECSTETYSLGRLKKTFDDGAMSQKVKVWPADGSGWRRVGHEIEAHCGVALPRAASRAETIARDAGSKVLAESSKAGAKGSKVVEVGTKVVAEDSKKLLAEGSKAMSRARVLQV